jgi:hypothetical protein
MRTNEKVTTIHEWDDINVKVNYFWAEDDKMVKCNDQVPLPVGWLHAKVRIDLLEFTENLEGLGISHDFHISQLYINDEFIGELFEIKMEEGASSTYLRCDVVIGAG